MKTRVPMELSEVEEPVYFRLTFRQAVGIVPLLLYGAGIVFSRLPERAKPFLVLLPGALWWLLLFGRWRGRGLPEWLWLILRFFLSARLHLEEADQDDLPLPATADREVREDAPDRGSDPGG